jgi:OmpA family
MRIRIYTLLGAAVVLAGCAGSQTPGAAAGGSQVQLMYVQSAEDLRVDAAKSTLRLVKVNPQTLYFSDRPQRIAGNIKMSDYLKTWKEGRDNFGADPPNATLSIYEPGRTEPTLVVVTRKKPNVDGADLLYTYKIVEGTMPAGGGTTSVFIDWYGVGGGVGPGYHGVGVLSSARADNVVRYLVSKGVPSNNISAQGFGDSRPVASNSTAEGRAKNRRVDIVIAAASRP